MPDAPARDVFDRLMAFGLEVRAATVAYTLARDLFVPFVVDGMYKGWLDAGGSSVGDVLDGDKEIRTGFRGAAKGLPGFFGFPVSIYKSTVPERGKYDLSDIAEPQ
jgi:hypothetical protein